MKATKEHILETAFKLFVEKTFKEVTMKEIVNSTGLSKGAFYHYFESKEQLFFEVITDYLLSNLRIDYNQFGQQSLLSFFQDHLKFIDQRRSDEHLKELYGQDMTYSNLYTLIFEAIKFFPELKEKFGEFDVTKLNAWTNVINNARKTGEIASPMSDEQIAQIFLCIMESTGLRFAMALDRISSKERLKMLWDVFYRSITNNK